MVNEQYVGQLKSYLKQLKKGSLSKSVLRTIIRVKALIAYYQGITLDVVASCYDCSQKTIKRWIKKFEKLGFDGLPDAARRGRPSKLSEEDLLELKQQIASQTNRVWLARHIYILSINMFGVVYSIRYIPELLRRLGLSFKKLCHFLSRRDSEVRRQWITEKLPKIYSKKIEEGWRIFYVDEVGFQTNGTLAKSWGVKGQKIELENYGVRARVNLIGAFELGTGMFYGALRSENINSQLFGKFIRHLKIRMKTDKIILICDNASFHKANWLREWIEKQSSWLMVEYLPPYSPDFNPIERLWRWMKTEFTHNKCFKNKDHLLHYLSQVIRFIPFHAKGLRSLMRKENKRFELINEYYDTNIMLPFQLAA